MKRTVIGIALYPNYGSNLAEMEGFEPPHVLRRLADFESAPFSRLGTSPRARILYQLDMEKSSFFRHLHHQLQLLANLIIILPSVRNKAIGAILNAVFRVMEIAAATIPQGIQRTIAEKTAKGIRISALVTREIFTFLVLEKVVMSHCAPTSVLI